MGEEMQLALEHTLKTMRKLKEAKAEIERLRAAMSDAEKAYQATPASTLEEQIMNPCIAKNEREWWAAAEIERLRDEVERLNERNAEYIGTIDRLRRRVAETDVEIERLRDVLKTAIRQFEDGNRLSCHRTLCDEVHGRQK